MFGRQFMFLVPLLRRFVSLTPFALLSCVLYNNQAMQGVDIYALCSL